MKKIILIIIISSIIFSSSGILSQPAKAIWGVGDVVFDPTAVGTFLANAAKEVWRWAKDNWVKMMRDLIVRRITDAMVDDVVNWIQGGGDPRFVTDWEGFLGDAFQAGVGDVVKDLDMARLCSPFGAQVQLSINYLPVEKFSQRVECTLDDIVANIEDFYDDFENGGWIAYNEIWKPQNNFYGIMLMTHDEMLIRGAQKQETAKNEAIAGAGFLSQKQCQGNTFGAKENCELYENGSCAKDSEGMWCAANSVKIITPGDTIAGIVTKVAVKDFDYIDNVQSYLAAIINATINRLFSEGLALMKDSTSSGGTSYDYGDVGYEDIGSQDLENQKQQLKSEYEKFLNEKQYILDAKNKSLSSSEQILQILQSIKDNCPTCLPQVSNAEINNAQSEVNRLKNDVADLEEIVNELNDLITEINNVSPDNRDREIALVFQHYEEFTSKYDVDSIYQDIINGNKRQAADNEASNKRDELISTQARINLCNVIWGCTVSP